MVSSNKTKRNGERTLKQMFKDIKEEDERSDSEQEDLVEAKPNDEELDEGELQMMQNGILDALK